MRSSSCTARKRLWPRPSSSCSCTRISFPGGRERVSCVHLRSVGLETRLPLSRSAAVTAADAHRAILSVWRIEQPRLITRLARLLRDVTLAEDLTQDALLAALESWPDSGVPERPGAWLMRTVKNRALDHLRRRRMLERTHPILSGTPQEQEPFTPDFESALDDDIGDELLRLIF